MSNEVHYWNPVQATPINFPCPCCGYQTLCERPPGTFGDCPVRCWEDDGIQFDDIRYEGGANRVSLRQARRDFRRFGVSDKRLRRFARPPLPNEEPRLSIDGWADYPRTWRSRSPRRVRE